MIGLIQIDPSTFNALFIFHRFEGIELARDRDERAIGAWKLHPYVDVVDNDSDFDAKVRTKN